MRGGTVEPFFQSMWISVWLLCVIRCTVSLPCVAWSGESSCFLVSWQRERHCCFAEGGTAPSTRLSAWDLSFQELVKSDCDLQTWFQSCDWWIYSEHTLPCVSPSSSPSCFTIRAKPGQAYLAAHGKMFWKEQIGGREVRRSSPVWPRCSNVARYLDADINNGDKSE